MELLDQCDDKRELPNTVENLVISQKGLDKVVVNGTYVIRREATPPKKNLAKITIHKCPSIDNKDLCEYYFTWENEDFCAELDNSKSLWRTYWAQTKLPKKCGTSKKGSYSLDGMSAIIGLGMVEGYYKARATGTSAAGVWFCVQAVFQFKSEKKTKKQNRQQSNKKRSLISQFPN